MRQVPFGFEKEYNIRFYDCDYTGKIKVSALLRYLADISELHYEAKGFGHDLLWKKGMVFLLSGESVRFHSVPRGNQTVRIWTWEREIKGARFFRDFEVYGEDGALLVSASSSWLLADPVSRQILRPAAHDFHPDLHPEKQADVLPFGRIRTDEPEQQKGCRPVRFSDLDNNRHVYHAVYADMAFDLFEPEQAARPVRDFRIHYSAEATFGDELTLSTADSNGETVVRGRKADGTLCFEAAIGLTGE